jgi:hypothetical protein
MSAVRPAPALLLLLVALVAGLGVRTSAVVPARAPAVTVQADAPTAPVTPGTDDMYWD